MDHNQWTGVGRLTRPPVFVPAGRVGTCHCTFTLAVNRVVAGGDGPKADFFPCSLWGEPAERFVEECSQGDEVGIVAAVRTNYVQKPDGSSQCLFEMRVDEIHPGRKSLKNLKPRPAVTPTTEAVGRLQEEFTHE